nr:phosphoribosylanthranilate isomerase [Lachnoclostridium sp. An169]
MNSMTKIKLCGLMTAADILTANELMPDYIGFVFAPKSRRYVVPGQAERLKGLLDPRIRAVGVFVNEAPERIAELLEEGIIDIAQLHGSETPEYVRVLRALTDRPLIQAFRADSPADPSADSPLSSAAESFSSESSAKESSAAESSAAETSAAESSAADYILLDSGSGGTGETFDWERIRHIRRPYFLAGGLTPDNAAEAVHLLHPYAVDVSSGIETDGHKDRDKMIKFVHAVREACRKEDEQ